MKGKLYHRFCMVFLAVFFLVGANASAQSVAYRQTDITSDLPGIANSVTPDLFNPWGIAFLSGQSFFIANNNSGTVTFHDTTSFGLLRFKIPNPAGTGPDHPTGIVADQNSSFGGRSLVQPFLVVTEEGRIYFWGPDAQGNLLPEATLAFNNAHSGAVYKGVAIVSPPDTNTAVAAANFHAGTIDTFLPGFNPVALPGSFTDSNLPAGYAPFGIHVIGNQVFVTYALQDPAKHDPVIGAGNGIVSIFDMDGNFVRRFATSGPLNAPWGVTQATANFGPFSNDILIGNLGDGSINAFDPATGNFVGAVKNGDGNPILDMGLHALTFRSDGFASPNTLYLTAGIANGVDGVFAAITPGLVSTTRVSVPPAQTTIPAPVTVAVSAGPGNPGTPTGQVAILDGGVQIALVSLTNGGILFPEAFDKVGTHVIEAHYSGDANFLPSSFQTVVEVSSLATTLTLLAPATATPGSTVILTATTNSAGGIPTGDVVFHDGNNSLATIPLDNAGSATLRINTLAAGTHTLTASYAGDGKFGVSTSAAVTVSIANPDFSLAAAPPSATVTAGQSTQFMLTVTPAGGFANNVTFSCLPITGITCAFNPATVTPANGAASTMLTVTTSASVPRYGLLLPNLLGPGSLLAAIALFGLLLFRSGNFQRTRAHLLTATAVLAILGLSFTLGGCGGYGGTVQSSRGTASIMVTAQSGTVSHTTTVMVTVQ